MMGIKISTSSYIGLSGTTPTTPQFSNLMLIEDVQWAFVPGYISCDVNPLPEIQLYTHQYTEIEWCISGDTVNMANDVYQFRVTDAGDTFSEYPEENIQWTSEYTTPTLIQSTFIGSSASTSKPALSNYR